MENTLYIYYATMTGNAEHLARDADKKAAYAGWVPQLHNLSEASPESLRDGRIALFIVSTWGDGEPPDDAADFFDELVDSEVDLSSLNYAILGLGDESYPDFNQFAKDLDEQLSRLKAKSFHQRIDADIDFDDTYAEWIDRVLSAAETQKTGVVPQP